MAPRRPDGRHCALCEVRVDPARHTAGVLAVLGALLCDGCLGPPDEVQNRPRLALVVGSGQAAELDHGQEHAGDE